MARRKSDDIERRAQEEGRGRSARRPRHIPAAGWKDIALRVYEDIGEDRAMLVAAGVTFYILLALVPAMSALVSIYGLFSDPSEVQQQMAALGGLLPGGAKEILNEQLTRLAKGESATLGVTFTISLLIALWSANAGTKALFTAMNVAYDEPETRGFFKLTLVTLAFTLIGIVAAIVFVAVVLAMPAALKAVGFGAGLEWLIRIGGYAAMALFAVAGVAALHRWGPSRRNAKWRWITPGAALSVAVVFAASIGFSYYVANFGSYNKTYGSLGAIVGFMTWIWISLLILIVGGELNSEIEHQTAEDTTTGRDRPIGERGAAMADTIGAATTKTT